MFDQLKHWFIPHEGNAYKPLFLRIGSVAAVCVLSVGLFFGATYFEKAIQSGNLAAVISAVLVNLANTDRANNGLGTLTTNDLLTQAAQLKANDMAAQSYFAHTSPAGVTPWHWFKEAGYQFQYAGENLAVYFSDSNDVNTAWMNSPSHRANILNEHFTEIGVATAYGMYQGQPTVFVVQMFGFPATEKPTQKLVTLETNPVPKTTPQVKGIATTTNQETVTQEVKGTSLQTQDENLHTIVSDQNFIAVKNNANVASTASPSATSTYVSFMQRLITSPSSVLSWIYFIIALLLGVALAFLIGIEIRHQHLPSIALVVGMILLLGILLYVHQTVIIGAPLLIK